MELSPESSSLISSNMFQFVLSHVHLGSGLSTEDQGGSRHKKKVMGTTKKRKDLFFLFTRETKLPGSRFEG